MALRQETQYAIRMVKGLGGGFNYKTMTADNEGTRFAGDSRPFKNADEAKNLLGMYQKQYCPTVVSRVVTIDEGEWVEIAKSEVLELAEILHKKQCHANHVDQCDWEYNHSSNRKRFEEKASKLLEVSSFEAIKELLDLM